MVFGRFRRLGVALAVIGGVASAGLTASPAVAAPMGQGAAAACTGPRVVSVTRSRVVEGSIRGGFTTLNVAVTSTGCPLAGSVRYQTVAYTARAKEDFVVKSGTIAYKAGTAAATTVSVQVVADLQPEPNECFSLLLSVPTGGARIGVAEAPQIIVNDDHVKGGVGGGFICSE
ncbi:MAG TPA: Calx-beta domain-containing protein [Mycobacteriales bacterium]|nr:Calx-beta domain-containing protein [Mycobacteriales bacterium]